MDGINYDTGIEDKTSGGANKWSRAKKANVVPGPKMGARPYQASIAIGYPEAKEPERQLPSSSVVAPTSAARLQHAQVFEGVFPIGWSRTFRMSMRSFSASVAALHGHGLSIRQSLKARSQGAPAHPIKALCSHPNLLITMPRLSPLLLTLALRPAALPEAPPISPLPFPGPSLLFPRILLLKQPLTSVPLNITGKDSLRPCFLKGRKRHNHRRNCCRALRMMGQMKLLQSFALPSLAMQSSPRLCLPTSLRFPLPLLSSLESPLPLPSNSRLMQLTLRSKRLALNFNKLTKRSKLASSSTMMRRAKSWRPRQNSSKPWRKSRKLEQRSPPYAHDVTLPPSSRPCATRSSRCSMSRLSSMPQPLPSPSGPSPFPTGRYPHHSAWADC